MDYTIFWEKLVSSWTIRPDVEGAAVIDYDGTVLKQTAFCRREQRHVMAACCISAVSVSQGLTQNLRLKAVDSIFIQSQLGLVIIRPLSDAFCLVLLVRKDTILVSAQASLN